MLYYANEMTIVYRYLVTYLSWLCDKQMNLAAFSGYHLVVSFSSVRGFQQSGGVYAALLSTEEQYYFSLMLAPQCHARHFHYFIRSILVVYIH